MEKKSRAEYYRKYNALNRDKKREQDRRCKDRKALAKGTKPTPRRYATREVDLSQMRHVQVNAKTWVLAPKDADPETVKQQFLKLKAA